MRQKPVDPVEFPPRVLPRSIFAQLGLKPTDDAACTGCCRPDAPDVQDFGGDPTCSWCRSMYLRTPFAEAIVNQMIYNRRKTFDGRWNCLVATYDGAAWVHPVKGLKVVEAIALEHQTGGMTDEVDDMLPMWPGKVEKTEFGPVSIAQTWKIGGIGPRVRGDVNTDADAKLQMTSDLWEFANTRGWQWWQHLAIVPADGRTRPTWDQVGYVKSQFATDEREAYVRFPALTRWNVDHGRAVHIWHSLHGAHGEDGRVLPEFDPTSSGWTRK